MLSLSHTENDDIHEIGVDEAGRGPLFGRVYAAAVLLPKNDDSCNFDFSLLKDSKKFTSKKKLLAAADYIKENAIAWSVAYEEENVIDQLNILQATQSAMHKAIGTCVENAKNKLHDPMVHLLVDGNYFNSYIQFDKNTKQLNAISHTCVKGGDNTYASIAAASILAKTERDIYIEILCDEYPLLDEHYRIRSNKGYGSKHHLQGIHQYGITQWHRKSFAPCKNMQKKNDLKL